MGNLTELHIALHNMHVNVKGWKVLIITWKLPLKQRGGRNKFIAINFKLLQSIAMKKFCRQLLQ